MKVSQCRGVVFIVSGLGEHSGRYDAVAKFLNAEGFVVFSQDNQGTGGSEGLRLYVDDFNDFVDDVHTFVTYILEERYKAEMETIIQGDKRRLILLGHSMGGLIAALAALDQPDRFGGVILSGPAFTSPLHPGRVVTFVLHWLVKVLPKLKVAPLEGKLHLCSANPPVQELLLHDPLYAHGSLRAHFARELSLGQKRLWRSTSRATFPLLMIHGEKDGLCGVDGSERFFKEAPSTHKSMKVYPGAFHEVLTEVCHEEVWLDVMAFILNLNDAY